jgi:hypothetical protein
MKPTWPTLPFNLPYLATLSDEPAMSLYVSPRTIYVLQNAVQSMLINPSNYAEMILGEYYIPTRPDRENWDLYTSVAEDLARDLVEVDTMDFNLSVMQGIPVSTTVQVGEATLVGTTLFFSLKCTATTSGTSSNAIELWNIPEGFEPAAGLKIVGSGIFADVSTGTRYLVALQTSADRETLRLWGDSQNNLFGLSPAITLASGDQLDLVGRWEI